MGLTMTVEEAIISALDYEHKVRDHYRSAAGATDDSKGKSVFGALADEEQGHVDYLESRLEAWRRDGKLDRIILNTSLPTRDWIASGKAKMLKVSLNRSYANEINMLKAALKLEEEVSEHYRLLVSKVAGNAKQMFARFLEIEAGHTAIVRAEIDGLEKNHFWFDLREFDLESA
jgi:rubrerythrin